MEKGERMRSEALAHIFCAVGRSIKRHAGKVLVVIGLFSASALLGWTLPLVAWTHFK